MADSWNWTPTSRLCFVTTGATAPFTGLIETVLSREVRVQLIKLGYTHLLVQYGSAKDVYSQCITETAEYASKNLVVDGMDFNPDGLQAQFQLVQRSKGLVISHAGTISRTGNYTNLS